ncbi:MAG: PdaC/SigV domain-containing protein [Flavobacteriales bacterium]
MLAEIIIPVAEGNNNITNIINSDIKNEVIKSLQIGDAETIESNSIEESITIFNDEYTNFKRDFPEVSQPWEAQIDGEIMYQSLEIISMSLTTYINTGGAQGNLNISFLNYDAKTGNRIKNIDLFNNIDDFKNVAKAYFEDAVENKSNAFNPNSFELPENIGYNDEGIILLFNAYETAPYASEIIEFIIPFEKVNSFLNFDSAQ